MSDHESNDISGTKDRPEIVKAQARVYFVESLWRWFLALLLAVTLTLVTVDTLQGRDVRNELVDCTTPGGECYAEGQQRTAEAIGHLIEANELGEVETRRIVVAAAACAEQSVTDDIEEIQDCVDRTLKLDKEMRN